MKLPYGVNNGNFIHISEVPSGRSTLQCPFCKQSLLAKKGKIKRHHFAHDGKSCMSSFDNNFFSILGKLPIHLPLCMYAKHKIASINTQLLELQQQHQLAIQKDLKEQHLIPELLSLLSQLEQKYTSEKQSQKAKQIKSIQEQTYRYTTKKIAPFPEFHLIKDKALFKDGFTDGKKTCLTKEVHQDIFEYFYPIALDQHIQCLRSFHHQLATDIAELKSKVALFQQELDYFNLFDLYFIEVTTDTEQFHKIGLTSRAIDTRLKEIKRDLTPYYPTLQLKVLFLKKGVAFTETFFKQKYSAYQLPIGKLTEYFKFSNQLLFLILKDFKCLSLEGIPERGTENWIYWAYFNSNGKLYGGQHSRSIYVNNEKHLLSKKEGRLVERLIGMGK